MHLIRNPLIIVRRNIIFWERARSVKGGIFIFLNYLLTGKDFKISLSRTELGRDTRSLPDMTTTSIAGSMCFLTWRKISRIFLLAWLRATAFPIFFETMTPSRFLSRPFGRKKTVQKFFILCFWPRFVTCSNWGRLARRSLFPNENSLIKLNSQTFAPFAPAVGQNSSTTYRGASFTEPVGSLSFQIFGLKRHLHGNTRPFKNYPITYW